MQKENIRSHRQFCIKYGIRPTTLAEYLKGRLKPEFIGKLAFITGCSESWLLVGQGEMFGENTLAKEQDGRLGGFIRIPFGWEVSVFTPEKLHGQVAYLNVPALYPFDRNVPRKPRLVGGVKGHNMKRNYFTGKPRPVGGELHMIAVGRKMLALYLDANAKLIGCKIQRGSVIVIGHDETEVKPGNSYVLIGKKDGKVSIRDLRIN